MTKLRDLSYAELACALRALDPNDAAHRELFCEAARRLERTAIERQECKVYPSWQARIVFPRCSTQYATVHALPVPVEFVVVDGLEPGEHRAVDVFGEVAIVQRIKE